MNSRDLHLPFIPLLHLQRQSQGYRSVVLRADPCAYCGEPGGTLDHIEPQVRVGDRKFNNLAGACSDCNADKRSYPLLVYLLARRRAGSGDRDAVRRALREIVWTPDAIMFWSRRLHRAHFCPEHGKKMRRGYCSRCLTDARR